MIIMEVMLWCRFQNLWQWRTMMKMLWPIEQEYHMTTMTITLNFSSGNDSVINWGQKVHNETFEHYLMVELLPAIWNDYQSNPWLIDLVWVIVKPCSFSWELISNILFSIFSCGFFEDLGPMNDLACGWCIEFIF